MMQASQTFRKEKAPSVDALKGFGLFDAESACFWTIETAMTWIEAAGMTHNSSHAERSGSRVKLRYAQACDVMARSRIEPKWNAAP